MTYEVSLPGLRPAPLMSYLKALGVLRVISEQVDQDALGFWKDGAFCLRSSLDKAGLIAFFSDPTRYQPTLILSPWNGMAGFIDEVDKAKAGFDLVCAIRSGADWVPGAWSGGVRAVDDAQVIHAFSEARNTMKRLEKKKKEEGLTADEQAVLKAAKKNTERLKVEVQTQVRNGLPDELLGWMDACISVLGTGEAKTAQLFGAGGCDGTLEFSVNYLKHVQALRQRPPLAASLFSGALFGGAVPLFADDEDKRPPIGQFSPGEAGGPNSTVGFGGDPLFNRADFVLMMEGALLFAGGVTRRLGLVRGQPRASFPFTVDAVMVGHGSSSPNEADARGEVWLPLWDRPTGLEELQVIFSEGRAEVGGRAAVNGVDFARAVSSLGVDRGLTAFSRFGLMKRNGLSYLATPLGEFPVRALAEVDLLREADAWLTPLRREEALASEARAVDQAILAFCRQGGAPRFADVLCALGALEARLAGAEKLRADPKKMGLKPLVGLSAAWAEAADDHSPEFRLALSLAALYDANISKDKQGPLRTHWEPITVGRRKDGRFFAKWADQGRALVFSQADLVTNLSHALERRLMDGERLKALPLASPHLAPLADVVAFLNGQLDEARLFELLRGLSLVDLSAGRPALRLPLTEPIPRAFALLAPLFAARYPASPSTLRPDARLIGLLKAGRVPEALALAMQRSRAAGFAPLPHRASGRPMRDGEWAALGDTVSGRRLLAALLFPLSQKDLGSLAQLSNRPESDSPSATAERSAL